MIRHDVIESVHGCSHVNEMGMFDIRCHSHFEHSGHPLQKGFHLHLALHLFGCFEQKLRHLLRAVIIGTVGSGALVTGIVAAENAAAAFIESTSCRTGRWHTIIGLFIARLSTVFMIVRIFFSASGGTTEMLISKQLLTF